MASGLFDRLTFVCAFMNMFCVCYFICGIYTCILVCVSCVCMCICDFLRSILRSVSLTWDMVSQNLYDVCMLVFVSLRVSVCVRMYVLLYE